MEIRKKKKKKSKKEIIFSLSLTHTTHSLSFLRFKSQS